MKWNWFGRIVVALSFCVLPARSAAHVPDSPWEMAAETERRIVEGAGARFPFGMDGPAREADSAVFVDDAWPLPFQDRIGEAITMRASPDTGCYEFIDGDGEVFWTVVPVAPLTWDWVSPFRSSDRLDARDLYSPFRLSREWVLLPHAEAAEPFRLFSGRRAPGASNPAPSNLQTFEPSNLCFASFSLSATSLLFTASWPTNDPPPDPIGPAGGLNPYAYGGGNPLEWIDPFGLCPVHDPLGDMANGSDSSGVEFLTRLGGFAQMVGGTLESALGLGFAVFTAETGAGVAGGLAVAYHGWDVATAGWDTMVSGDPQDSMTSQAMQSLGVPRNYANGIDAGFSIIGTMGVGSAMSAGYKESTFSLSEYNHQIANNIANGHAYTRHSAQFGFTTREEMAAHIERIMNHPSAMKPLARGRMAFWDDASQTIVIFDPYRVDQGTAFIPDHGLRYFLEEIK